MQTAVIYCRYSSDSQTEQSIDGQLRVCTEYAKSRDILILDTYIDRAMTGTNDNRPDFRRMIKDSAKRTFNMVLVYKFDRFSRNKYETAMHKKTLKDNGEVFDNIYPQIVPQETFDIVRKKVNCNKYGKRSDEITYLLKDKIKCGYCGKSIVGDNGTSRQGERKYYYKCRGRK